MQKNIVLGVTGGIAAYKAADLCSKLTQLGYNVQVIMTNNAQEFITPLTFMTLSKNVVITELFKVNDWRPEHVAIAEKADFAVIAPATANIIGKMTHGIADDALSTFLITFRKTILVAPAMNPAMYENAAVAANIMALKSRGIHFIGPASGHVACGSGGVGRMSEPADIIAEIQKLI